MDFQNKTVLITGASSGIGKEFAEKLAAAKANLVLTARREKNLAALADELKQKHGVRVDFFAADISRPDAPWQIYEWLHSRKIEIDVLVNNAGFGAYGPFDAMPIENIQAMMQVNMHALVLMTRIFLPQIKARKGGVIQIASTAAFQPVPYLALYAATKAFVKSFSEGIWSENRDVRIFCLCPGNTESEFHDTAGIHQKKVFLRATAEDLVSFGISKFLNSSAPTRIHGALNSVLAFLNRLSPSRLALWITDKIYKLRSE